MKSSCVPVAPYIGGSQLRGVLATHGASKLISNRCKRPLAAAVSCLLCLSFAIGPTPAKSLRVLSSPARLIPNSEITGQVDADVRLLEAGKTIERELKGGDAHLYQIALSADQYLEIVVEQKGINLSVALSRPDGQKVMNVDDAKGMQGTELLTYIAKASGPYRIEVRPAGRNSSPGLYQIVSWAPRTPTPKDRALEEARILSEESRILRQKGKYDEALNLAERALAIREETLGPDHTTVADSLHALASLYDDKSDYGKAEPLNLRALAIREKNLGPDHLDVAKTLNNLAWIYGVRQDYSKAEAYYRRALGIQEKLLGADDPEVATTLNDLALLYYEKGDYERSIEVNQRVLAIREKTLGPADSGVAKALNNLALVYEKKGEYAKAEAIYKAALTIWENALGVDHPEVSFAVDNLARVYFYQGDYTKSEPLHQRALTIREKALGPENPSTITSRHNLAVLYLHKGDYARAEPLFQRVITAWEKALGPDNARVAQPISNLAKLYESVGDYERAEPLYQRALAIREKTLGPKHPEVGESLNNLGQIYLKRKDDARAEALLQRSRELLEKAMGPDYPGVALPLSNLAALYENKGDDGQAEILYQRALAIREKALGPNHPDVAQSLNSLARLYRKKGFNQKALALMERSQEIREHNLYLNLPVGSERQKLDYLKLYSADTDEILSFQNELAPLDSKALRLAFTTLLRRKGRALDAMSASIASLRSRSNPQDQVLFSQLFDARSHLAAVAIRGPDKNNAASYVSRLKRLEDDVDRLEIEVTARSAAFRSHSQPITLESIQALLPEGTALIEFARYQAAAAKTDGHEQSRYAAYLLVAGRQAQCVDLGAAEPIDRAVAAWRRALRDPQRTDANRLARALDEKVMRPVRELCGQSQHLLISPDGSLNVIPFAALVDERNRYLVERFSITYLTSGRDLLRLQVASNSRTGPVVVADPAFGEPATIPPPGDAIPTLTQAGTAGVRRTRVDYSQVFFGPLPGVGAEVRALRELLPRATFLTKEQATKAALKQVSGPSILHIATHGFFLEDSPSESSSAHSKSSETGKVNVESRLGKWATWVDNPLLRSGLALAGANQGRGGDDDGVLTALEASGLDLWGTKLVVLSACDTGVGDVRNGDGVYGLRRSLVLAGAESQVMSLWPVSDRSTGELMTGYYRALVQGQGRGEALRQEQLLMLHSKSRSHPYYWAGFIQSGEWANLEGKR